MKLHVVTDQGTLLGTVDGLQMYDLDRAMGRGGLLDDIKAAIRGGAKLAAAEGEYVPTFNECRDCGEKVPEQDTRTARTGRLKGKTVHDSWHLEKADGDPADCGPVERKGVEA